MTMKRIPMKKLRELLRLKFDAKLTHRQIGRALAISAGSVSYYVQAAMALGITWPLEPGLDDVQLMQQLERHAKQLRQRSAKPLLVPLWDEVQSTLSGKHMTLALIWEDYAKLHPGQAYSYAQFTRLYKAWAKCHKVSLRMEHKAGDKAFIDYAGDTVPIYCRKTKIPLFNAHLFIMVLGASQYTFAYACESQSLPNWIAAHVRAFEFFGGTPRILVPDNLKSAIKESCPFEPLANPTYADMAAHYNTAIVPARPYTPKDKASAENGVLIAERRIIARLSKQRFYSLAALNKAIEELMKAINHRPFQKRQGSRYSQFAQVEQPALRALPPTRYEFAHLKQLTVPPDYHVRLEGHYYSVPYTLVGQSVFCRCTTTTIEILHQNQRVASHPKSVEKDKKTTCPLHMPLAHRHYVHWTPELFIEWAQGAGSAVHRLAVAMMASKPQPEQWSKFHFGLKKLARCFGDVRLNQACQRALTLNCLEFKSIQSILEHHLDQAICLAPVNPSSAYHGNLRGPAYYQH